MSTGQVPPPYSFSSFRTASVIPMPVLLYMKVIFHTKKFYGSVCLKLHINHRDIIFTQYLYSPRNRVLFAFYFILF